MVYGVGENNEMLESNDLGGSGNKSFIFLRQILPCFYTQPVEIRANCMIFSYFLDSFVSHVSLAPLFWLDMQLLHNAILE